LKKISTRVTDANEGMHTAREFQKAKEMLEGCRYVNARLYHVSFKGSEQVKPYQTAMKTLCERLRRNRMPCQWRACIEADEGKGLHWHAYILVEAKKNNPDHIINRKSTGWLTEMVTKLELEFYLNPPQSRLHWDSSGEEKNYATLPKSKPAKLKDCIEWISYLYKVRSKFIHRPIYFSSRQTKEKLHPEPEGEAGAGVGACAGASA
jgi:hypothetical protein